MTKKIFLLMYGLFMFATYSVHAMDQSWLPCNQQPGACTAQSGLPRQSVVLPEPPLDMSPEAQIARAVDPLQTTVTELVKKVLALEMQAIDYRCTIQEQEAHIQEQAASIREQDLRSTGFFEHISDLISRIIILERQAATNQQDFQEFGNQIQARDQRSTEYFRTTQENGRNIATLSEQMQARQRETVSHAGTLAIHSTSIESLQNRLIGLNNAFANQGGTIENHRQQFTGRFEEVQGSIGQHTGQIEGHATNINALHAVYDLTNRRLLRIERVVSSLHAGSWAATPQ